MHSFLTRADSSSEWMRSYALFGGDEWQPHLPQELDRTALTDDWIFHRGETFEKIGQHTRQGAPARVALGSLTLQFDRSSKAGRVLAQDLVGDSPMDVTDQVKMQGSRTLVPGDLIERIGSGHLSARVSSSSSAYDVDIQQSCHAERRMECAANSRERMCSPAVRA